MFVCLFRRGLLDNLCGVSGNDHIVGYVVRHHAAGANNHAVADSHSGTDYYATAQPAVVADADGQPRLDGLASLQVVVRVVRGKQLAVGAYQRVVADGYAAAVEEDAVEIDDHPFAEGDALAVVAVKRRDDQRRRVRVGQQVVYAAAKLLLVPCTALVQGTHRLVGVHDAGLNLLVGIVVRQVAEHFLVFCHGNMSSVILSIV